MWKKTADKPSAEVGDKITYTVTLGNAEGAVYEIENASMTDIIPAELDFVDGSVQVDGVSTGYSFDNETRTPDRAAGQNCTEYKNDGYFCSDRQ